MLLSRRALLAAIPVAARAQTAPVLPPWQSGHLDLHHISTGRGNATFCILPDGTTLMIDAGAQRPTAAQRVYYVPAYPDESRRPGEWIARYVRRHLDRARLDAIDHFFLTHFHSDHMGEFQADLPSSRHGSYKLAGIPDLAESVSIRHLVDRAWPDYNYPAPLNDPSTRNYRDFLASAVSRGLKAERFTVGSRSQFPLLRNANNYPQFEIRNIVANGELWTGQGTATNAMFPPLTSLAPKDYPSENMCSAGIRIRYGAFDYYHAGDLCDGSSYGKPAWKDVETAAAKVVGPVDIALASHHGYIDSTGPDVVRALKPRAFIIHSWDSAHPTMPALHNMLSTELYEGPREIYATALKPEALVTIRRMNQLKSSIGHVVVRVAPGGASWSVFITSNADESDRITAQFGPFSST